MHVVVAVQGVLSSALQIASDKEGQWQGGATRLRPTLMGMVVGLLMSTSTVAASPATHCTGPPGTAGSRRAANGVKMNGPLASPVHGGESRHAVSFHGVAVTFSTARLLERGYQRRRGGSGSR